MPYRIYDTPALVIRRWPYKEASSRFFLYTRDLGRILARAQSVRKVSAKLAPALQVGSESEVSLVCGKSGWRLVGTSPQKNFLLSSAPTKRFVIDRFLRLLARLIPDQQRDPNLYKIISSGLKAVAGSDTREAVRANEKLLVLRTLVQLGYAPNPEADDLRPFIHSADYSQKVTSSFQPLTGQAVEQINESLKAIQL